MTIKEDTNRLRQEERKNTLLKKYSAHEFIPVYESSMSKDHCYFLRCSLVPNEKAQDSLELCSWDLWMGEGMPSEYTKYDGPGDEIRCYSRFTPDNGTYPLVLKRDFNELRPSHIELIEEFRLFHNLYNDAKTNKYIKFDDNGNEEVIAIVDKHKVTIRLKELKKFLAVKKMHLSLFFGHDEFSHHQLAALSLSSSDAIDRDDSRSRWSLTYTEPTDCEFSSCSSLCGKLLIAPSLKVDSPIANLLNSQDYKSFIIGADEEGDLINHSCNPDLLNNELESNPDSRDYLTAVHFRKNVLKKYYDETSKYSVADGSVSCGSLWSLMVDTDHQDRVIVWLGDLGSSLPLEEQSYWASFNIVPQGGVSEIYRKRQCRAIFTDTAQLDLVFKKLYEELQDACDNRLKWRFFREFSAGDRHHLASMHIPSSDEQKEFDEHVLSLTKLLIDSLNEKPLKQFSSKEEWACSEFGISRLGLVFGNLSVQDYEPHIQFLRDLQSLRSKGSAHIKGKDYEKVNRSLGGNTKSLISIFEDLLNQANDFLRFLIDAVNEEKFSSYPPPTQQH